MPILPVPLVLMSMATTFISISSSFSWGGAVGELINNWFVKWIGTVGTGAILVLSVFAYIIWRFNPVFRLSTKNTNINTDNGLIERSISNSYDVDEHTSLHTALVNGW